MFCATITITDITQKAQNLLTLLQNAGSGGTGTSGYSVKSKAPFNALDVLGGVAYVSLQNSNSSPNGSILYEGDEGVLTNGTLQGKELLPGDVDVHQAYPNTDNLAQIYITASVNGVIVNVQWSYS